MLPARSEFLPWSFWPSLPLSSSGTLKLWWTMSGGGQPGPQRFPTKSAAGGWLTSFWPWALWNPALATSPSGSLSWLSPSPVAVVLGLRLYRQPSIGNALWAYGFTLFVFLYFSRFLNENYLGFILAILALAYFTKTTAIESS